MTRVREVSDGVFEIHPELKFMFSLSYLVTGERSALIDPGSTAQAEAVMKALEAESGIDPDSIEYIIPTHLHLDHSGGAGYMAGRLPRAKVAVFERHAPHLMDPVRLVDVYKRTFGEDFEDRFGPVKAVSEGQVMKVADSDEIDLGGRGLTIMYTRGHANHHLCLLDDRTRGLFCGDALGMYFPDVDGVVIICPEGFDLDLQIRTIEQLGQLAPELLYYAHEGTGRDPARLMRWAVRELRDCGDLTLKALRAGEDSAQIQRRLREYFLENVATGLNYEKMYLELTVAGYREYFRKTGRMDQGGGN